jgi:hypothetical protein
MHWTTSSSGEVKFRSPASAETKVAPADSVVSARRVLQLSGFPGRRAPRRGLRPRAHVRRDHADVQVRQPVGQLFQRLDERRHLGQQLLLGGGARAVVDDEQQVQLVAGRDDLELLAKRAARPPQAGAGGLAGAADDVGPATDENSREGNSQREPDRAHAPIFR